MSGQEILMVGGDDAKAISAWDPNSGAPMPAYLAEALGELGTNIPDRQTVPSLSYEGKTWQIIKDGNKTKLQATNSDGDLVPVPVMRVVVLNFNADRGRSYFPGAYDPSKTDKPTCWSVDGVAPDASVVDKKSALCNGCPMSIKGSKVAEGREMVACSQHRMIVVVPGFDIETDPLRLKIAVTSDYDKEIVEHGWFAFRQYVDYCKSRGVMHTGMVITKIKFDPNAQYPKLLFAMDRVLQPHELAQMKAQLANPKVAELLAEKWTVAGSAGTPINDSDIRPHGLEGAYADGWIAHPDSAGYSYKGQEVLTNEELAARYPAPEPAAPPPIPAAAAPPSVPAAAPAAPVAVALTPHELAVADGWVQHPDSAPHGYKGSEVLEWDAINAKYAAEPAAPPAPAPAPAPKPEPAPAPLVAVDPLDAARADGWIVHPDAEGYHYKGQEVVADGDLAARYPTPTAGAAAPAAAASPPAASQSSAPTASPTEGVVTDPALAAMLDKWTS